MAAFDRQRVTNLGDRGRGRGRGRGLGELETLFTSTIVTTSP
jgi:hypothetical protein